MVFVLQQQGFTFGFVEYEVPGAVQKAIEVHIHLRFIELLTLFLCGIFH